MKKIIHLILLFTFGLINAQQINEGYYINNNDERIVGYFKDGDFSKEIALQFGTSINGSFTDLEPNNVKEYGGGSLFKYQKVTVKMEASSSRPDMTEKNVQWGTKTVFVNVILEGDASLYSYLDHNDIVFFYKVDSKNIPFTQLIFKKYTLNEASLLNNYQYKQQLFNDVKCNGQVIKDFYTVSYSKLALVKVFTNYNKCQGKAITVYKGTKRNRFKVDLTIFAGLEHSAITLQNTDPSLTHDKDTKTGFGFGGEVAVTIPSRKFSFFLRADHQKLDSEYIYENSANGQYARSTYFIDSSVINTYLGLRCNFFLTPKNKLFIDASAAYGYTFGSFKKNVVNPFTNEDRQVQEIDLGNDTFWNIGIGYMYNDKYGADLRVDTNRDFFRGTHTTLGSEISRICLNLRYTLN